MKHSILIAIAGLAFGTAGLTTQVRAATSYSSRTALIGSSPAEAASPAPTEVPRDQSTRISLLGIRQRVALATEEPISVAFYSTKAVIHGPRATEMEIAPLK